MKLYVYYLYMQFSEGEKPETKQKRLEAKYAALQIVPNVDKLGTAKVSNMQRIFQISCIFLFLCLIL